jgi:hypothetical protein
MKIIAYDRFKPGMTNQIFSLLLAIFLLLPPSLLLARQLDSQTASYDSDKAMPERIDRKTGRPSVVSIFHSGIPKAKSRVIATGKPTNASARWR